MFSSSFFYCDVRRNREKLRVSLKPIWSGRPLELPHMLDVINGQPFNVDTYCLENTVAPVDTSTVEVASTSAMCRPEAWTELRLRAQLAQRDNRPLVHTLIPDVFCLDVPEEREYQVCSTMASKYISICVSGAHIKTKTGHSYAYAP
jgi:hypothetical protein